MAEMRNLLAEMPHLTQSRLVCNGVICWVVYGKDLQASFFQTLSELGGWAVLEDEGQSLWFFPNVNILPGLGRLHNWSRLNPVSLCVVAFAGSLVVGEKFEQSLVVKEEFRSLFIEVPKRLHVLVSPQLRAQGRDIVGLSFKQSHDTHGLVGSWFDLESGDHLAAVETPTWLWFINPVGSNEDKVFVKGWRAFFERIEAVLVDNKTSYLHGENHLLIIHITSLKVLGRVLFEIMNLGSVEGEVTWPCAYALLQKDTLPFAPEAGRQMQYVLEALEPGMLHMPLNAYYQLKEQRLTPVDSRFSLEHTRITDLFQVRVNAENGGRRHGSLNIFLPTSLISGQGTPCFYCGQRTHEAEVCPSRQLQSKNSGSSDLERMGRQSLDALPARMQELENAVGGDVVQGFLRVVETKDNVAETAGALLEVNAICQLRSLSQVWRAKGKDWPDGLRTLRQHENGDLWVAFESFRLGMRERAVAQVNQAVLQSPKSYEPRVLLGFMAMEQGEYKKALALWQEAEQLTYTSLQRSYLLLLQGRLREIQGFFQDATTYYTRALRESPRFHQARYRQASCLLKSGFLTESLGLFQKIMESEPDYYTAMLFDVELEGARTPILSELWDMWMDARDQVQEVTGAVDHLPDMLAKWLPPTHEAYQQFYRRIEDMAAYAETDNYVCATKLIQSALRIRDEIQARVKKDIKELGENRKKLLRRLQAMRREVAWFPFPRFLRGFSVLFNTCVSGIQDMHGMDLYLPEKFRLAHESMAHIEDAVSTLEKKALFFQAIRNGALFLLLSGKYLLFFELAVLLLVGAVAGILFFLPQVETLLGRHLGDDRWLIINISLIFLSFVAFVSASVRAAARFEQYKERVLDRGEG